MLRLRRIHGEVSERAVSCLRGGKRGDLPLLLLHGIPTNSELWRPLLHHVAYPVRAAAPDLPGFGASAPPSNPSISAYHRFISAFSWSEGLERPVLIGHDLGGLYALTYAVAHPDRVRALVLMNTSIYPDVSVAAGLLPLLLPGVGEAYAWLAGRDRYRPVRRRQLTSIYPPQTPARTLEALVSPYDNSRQWYSMVRALRGLSPMRVLEWKKRIAQIRFPVLILWGEGDPYFPDTVPARFSRDLPTSRLAYIPGGGHFAMLTEPGTAAAQLDGFLSTLPPGGLPSRGRRARQGAAGEGSRV